MFKQSDILEKCALHKKRAICTSDQVTERSQPPAVGRAGGQPPAGAGPERGRGARRPGRLTLYPVTADSCSVALTWSQLSSTFVSVVFQTTFPGGRLGAGKTKWDIHAEASTEGHSARVAVTGGQQRGGAARQSTGPGRNQKSDTATLPHARHFHQGAREFASSYSPCAPG